MTLHVIHRVAFFGVWEKKRRFGSQELGVL